MRISIILEALTGRFETDMARASRQARARSREIERSLQRMGSLAARTFAALGLSISIREFVQLADRSRQLENQLRLVTDASEGFASVQQRLFQIAQNARTSFEGTVSLYARMARATDDLNISQARLLGVTETINRALAISSVPAAAAEAALFQLSQGLAAGALRGEELNSVMEQTPRLARAIADGLGVSIGQLRELGKQGKITAEAIIEALEGQADVVREEFEKMEPTVSQGLTRIGNSMLGFVGRLDEAMGTSSLFARALEAISRGIDKVTEGMAQAQDPFRGASLQELRERLEGLRRLERLGRIVKEEDLAESIRETEEAIRNFGASYQEFLADLAERTRNAGRLNIDLSLSEKDVQFLNDFVAELEVSRQEAMREAERAAQKIREEDRRFLDDFVAELNTTRLSAGQDLSPELTVFIDQLREAEQLTEQFRTEAERNAETWRRAQELFAEGLISEETLNRVRDSIERMDQSFKDMGQSLGRGLRDSLVDAMTGIEVRWDDMLRRMIANAALDQLFNLLGTLGGPVGGVARFLGFGGARAAGGPVYPGRAYLVGERGPEIITPKAMGTVIPSHALGGTTIHVDARGSTDPAAVEVAVQRAVREAVQVSRAETHAMIGLMFRPQMA